MNEEEKRELDTMRDMFAGISLPGVIGRSGMFYLPEDIAKEAYDIAEAMIKERETRINKEDGSNS